MDPTDYTTNEEDTTFLASGIAVVQAVIAAVAIYAESMQLKTITINTTIIRLFLVNHGWKSWKQDTLTKFTMSLVYGYMSFITSLQNWNYKGSQPLRME